MAAVVAFDGPAAAAGGCGCSRGRGRGLHGCGRGRRRGGRGVRRRGGLRCGLGVPRRRPHRLRRCELLARKLLAGGKCEIVLEVNMAPRAEQSGEFPKQLALPKRGGVHCARNSWWAWRAGTAEAQRV